MTLLRSAIAATIIFSAIASPSLFAVNLSGSNDKQVSVMPGDSFGSSDGAVSYITVAQLKGVFDGVSAEGSYEFNGMSYHNFEIHWPVLTWLDSTGKQHIAQLDNDLIGKSYYGKVGGADVYILFEVTMLGVVASPYALSIKDVGINPEQKTVLFWR